MVSSFFFFLLAGEGDEGWRMRHRHWEVEEKVGRWHGAWQWIRSEMGSKMWVQPERRLMVAKHGVAMVGGGCLVGLNWKWDRRWAASGVKSHDGGRWEMA